MTALTITFQRNDNLADFDEILAQAAIPELTALVEQGTGIARSKAPVDTGGFRSSITNDVQEISPSVIEGRVFSTADPVVVEAIENGRQPGTYAPVDLITAWTLRRLAPDAKSLRDVAYKVNRKIFLYGIPGKFVFRDTLQEMQPLIERAGENVAAKVAKAI